MTDGATVIKAKSGGGGENINFSAATTFKTVNDALTFGTSAIDLANGANLTVNTGSGNIVLTDIHGDSAETVSITSTGCLLYTSPSPRDATLSRMPSSA